MDARDYALSAGPLFEQADAVPFPKRGEGVRPDPLEVLVASLIWKRKGRANPIPLAEIRRSIPELSERKIKEIVEELRLTHRLLIGARRDEPAGYFRIMDAEDREAAAKPYRAQIRRELQVLRALDEPSRVREFLGQLRLEGE